MPGVELEIPDLHPVHAGEPISGTLRARLREPTEVELSVYPHLTVTHGPNTVGGGYRDRVPVYAGPLAAGTHDLPFELLAPSGPASLAGQEVRLDWTIEAALTTASDRVRARTPLPLRPARKWGMRVTPMRGLSRPGDLESSSIGCGVVALLGTLALAGGAVAGWVAGEPDLWITLAIFGLGSALVCAGLFRSQRVYRLVGSTALTVEPAVVEPGRGGELMVSVTHREGAPVDRVNVTLAVVECRRKENSSSFSERPLFSETHPLHRTGDGAWSGPVKLPTPGAKPYTYMATQWAQIRWVVRSQLRGARIPEGAAQKTVWLEATHDGQHREEPPRYA